jgi:pectate lyase
MSQLFVTPLSTEVSIILSIPLYFQLLPRAQYHWWCEGTEVVVKALEEFKKAVTGDDKNIVIVDGTITGNEVVKTESNKTIIGRSGASEYIDGEIRVCLSDLHIVALTGVGIRVIKVSNVILRNLKVQKVLAEAADAIGIQEASQVWVDHLDLSFDRDHNEDFYDGLLDVTHSCTSVSIT